MLSLSQQQQRQIISSQARAVHLPAMPLAGKICAPFLSKDAKQCTCLLLEKSASPFFPEMPNNVNRKSHVSLSLLMPKLVPQAAHIIG
jgi:hypothetical protein